MTRLLWGVGLACALALGASRAQAQSSDAPPARPALSESLTGEAKRAYESAKLLLNNRDWAGAFTKFRESYDLAKDPRLLFNMALCARDLRRYALMQTLLVRYERESGSELSSEAKAEVDAALAAIKNLVAAVRLTVSESGAWVLVDGERVGKTPLSAPLVVDLGRHTLTVRKPGFEPVERSIESVGGEQTALDITLRQRVQRARLAVASAADATVIVDKREVSRGRFAGTLAPGVHEVQVTAPGKKTYRSRVELADGETRSLHVTLADRAESSFLWMYIAGGAAVAAGAAVGGYFLLRPHDERGPGPAGSLGTVELKLGSGGP